MQRFSWLCCVGIATVLSAARVHQAVADPPDILRDYRFIPSASTVLVTGNMADYALQLHIAGTFGLVTGYEGGPTPVASATTPPSLEPFAKFINVHGILFNPLSATPAPSPGWNLDKTLNLSGLSGTFDVGDPNQLFFLGADGQGQALRLEADIVGPWIHITGGTSDPILTADQRYQVNALAHLGPFPDANGDGAITSADLMAMLGAVANPTAYEASNGMSADDFVSLFDINGDGQVTNADVQAMIAMVANAQMSAATGSKTIAPVPEPTSAILLLVGAGIVTIHRAKKIALM